MKTLLVGYDLNQPVQEYAELIAALKAVGAWWHHLDSTWLVRTNLTASELRDRLAGYLSPGDELLVVDITGRAKAWRGFTERGSNWLRETY